MNRRRWLWLLLLPPLLLAVFLLGRASRPTFQPELYLVGDLAHSLTLSDPAALGKLDSVSVNGKTYRGLPLDRVIAAGQPAAEISRVTLIATDGFSVELAGGSLADCWLTYSADRGWRVLAPRHPLSANATRLQRIVVVAEQSRDTALLVTTAGTKHTFTIGQLYAGATLSYPYPEGTAEKETDGRTYRSTVSTRRDCLTLAQLGCEKAVQVQIIAANGETLSLPAASGLLFQLAGNRLDYINAAQRNSLENIKQITITE